MSRVIAGLLLLLVFAAAVGAFWHYWNEPQEPAPDDPSATKDGLPKAGSAPAELKGRPGAKTPDVPPNTKQKKGTEALPPMTTPLARRLGVSDAQATKVEAWHRHAALVQSQHGNVFEDGGEPIQATKEFNAEADKQRLALIKLLGADGANKALRELPLYKFDVSNGRWYRIDASGNRIPFQDPAKEDVWRNFQKKQ